MFGITNMDDIYLEKSLARIMDMNEDERFYKEYYEAGESPERLKQFLNGVDREDAVKRHLVIPEILPEIISYEMRDSEYFKNEDDRSVYISRHNRYTPSFLHRHDFFEIIFVMTGKCSQNIGLKRYNFAEGDLVFIAPGVFHTMEVFDEETAVLNILLRKSTFDQMFAPVMKQENLMGQFFSEGLYNTKRVEYLAFHLADRDLIDKQLLFLRIYREHLFHDAYSDQIMVGMLTAIFSNTMRDYQDTMESSYLELTSQTSDNFLVLSYIQNHLAEVSLSDVADHFGFSVSYCSKLIKATTGQGFNGWKRTLRMRQAEHMLLNTKKSVEDIAETLGYMNLETFIRTFKKEIHLTPSQYRKQRKTKKVSE